MECFICQELAFAIEVNLFLGFLEYPYKYLDNVAFMSGLYHKSVLTIQQCPDERNDLWTLTNVLQSFNTDTDIIQSHQHQPAEERHIQACSNWSWQDSRGWGEA